jgi:hypothetical protein
MYLNKWRKRQEKAEKDTAEKIEKNPAEKIEKDAEEKPK